MTLCPKGHQSQSSDYCDECGAPIGAAPSSMQAAVRDSSCCPECSTPRESGARFCEVCQYDFATASPAVSDSKLARSDSMARQALASIPSAAPAQPASTAPAPTQSTQPTLSIPAAAPCASSEPALLCRIQSDASLCLDDESRLAYPADGIPEKIFHLDLDENLIGRDSPSKNSNPEIALRDPGSSRRHLKIIKINGAYHALELGSANGTLLNGSELPEGAPAKLAPGSSIRLGMWTRILIEAR